MEISRPRPTSLPPRAMVLFPSSCADTIGGWAGVIRLSAAAYQNSCCDLMNVGTVEGLRGPSRGPISARRSPFFGRGGGGQGGSHRGATATNSSSYLGHQSIDFDIFFPSSLRMHIFEQTCEAPGNLTQCSARGWWVAISGTDRTAQARPTWRGLKYHRGSSAAPPPLQALSSTI